MVSVLLENAIGTQPRNVKFLNLISILFECDGIESEMIRLFVEFLIHLSSQLLLSMAVLQLVTMSDCPFAFISEFFVLSGLGPRISGCTSFA